MKVPPAEGFEDLRSALEEAGIRYAIGGSWASTAFGEPRFTNDVDILAELTSQNLNRFIDLLPSTFYVDADGAMQSIRLGRPFNIIHMPTVLKFDLFPAAAFPIGTQELDRAVVLSDSGLSTEPVPFVTPEDILLAKLYWFRSGGEASDVQWRDIQGIARSCATTLDNEYLRKSAPSLGVLDLLSKALDYYA